MRQTGTQCRGDCHRQQDRGECHRDVGETHEHGIDEAAEEAGDGPDRAADHRGDRDGDERDGQRLTCTVEDPGEDVAAQRIRPKQVLREEPAAADRGGEGIVRREDADEEDDETQNATITAPTRICGRRSGWSKLPAGMDGLARSAVHAGLASDGSSSEVVRAARVMTASLEGR